VELCVWDGRAALAADGVIIPTTIADTTSRIRWDLIMEPPCCCLRGGFVDRHATTLSLARVVSVSSAQPLRESWIPRD
jgi:hypothetical protein